MSAHVLALVVDLRIPASSSLKEKRSVVQSVLGGARRRFEVASAETDRQDQIDRAELTFVAASGAAGHTAEIIDNVDRFVWSFPEVDVVDHERHWLEVDR